MRGQRRRGQRGAGDLRGRGAGAAAQLDDLANVVRGNNLHQGSSNGLDAKPQNAREAVAAVTNGAPASGCNKPGAFASEVQAQAGTTLKVAQAEELLRRAAQICAVIGC